MNGALRDNRPRFWRGQHLRELELVRAPRSTHDFPRHFHEQLTVTMVLSGSERVEYRGCSQIAAAGSLVIINPGDTHSNQPVTGDGFTYRAFYVPTAMLAEPATAQTSTSKVPTFRELVIWDRDVFRSLLRFHELLEQPCSPLEEESSYLAAIGGLVARHSDGCRTGSEARSERRCVRLMRQFVEAHYAEPIRLADLSAITGLSPFHLLRTFRDEVGLPPHEFQTQLRVASAKALLRFGKSIATVAIESGFVDQSHLTRHFKRLVGVTPGQYVRRHRG